MKKVVDFCRKDEIPYNDFLTRFENKYGILLIILQSKKERDFFCGVCQNPDKKISYIFYNVIKSTIIPQLKMEFGLEYFYKCFKDRYDIFVFDTKKEYYNYISENIDG